ncbi:MAG: VOC family protein [Thermoanaerobaculia bacterium]|nr:VOC family protein [Thermoanaerobaculia bacterium]
MATRKTARTSTKPARKGAARKPAARAKAKPAAKKAPARRRRARPESLRLRSLVPGLTCNDLERCLDFYLRGLGFVVVEEWTNEGKRIGAMLRAGTCQLAIGQDDWKKGRDRVKGIGSRLYLETAQDVDALGARLKAAGYALASEPQTTDWSARELSVDDPTGFHLTIFQPLKKKR